MTGGHEVASEETAAARAAQADPGTRPRPIDVLAIGETMALVTPARPEPLESARDFHVGTGGAESNVACHLASAGRAVEWFSALGDDPLGRRVGAFIEASGVSIARVRLDPEAPTGLYVKDPGRGVSYYRRGSAASRLGPGDLAAIDTNQVRIVHLSGITLALSASCRDLVGAAIDLAHSAGALVSFDVNHRPSLWPTTAEAAEAIGEAARRADVVLVGRDEAEVLWSARTADDVRALFPQVPHLVVKDADVEAVEFASEVSDGSSAPDGSDRSGGSGSGAGRTAVATPRVEVVEVVGAGDAFAAGWLDALLDQAPPAERLARGHAWAARALSSTQDIPEHGGRREGDGSALSGIDSAHETQEATA